MIVVAIMSIMLAVGLPSFQSIIESSRLTSAANAMVSTLQQARFESLKQHKSVAVVPNTTWGNGWIVFVDTNDSHSQDPLVATEKTFASFDAIDSTITVASSYTTYVSYDASGRIKPIGGNFTFCTATEFRKVVIAATGRVRVETPTTCG